MVSLSEIRAQQSKTKKPTPTKVDVSATPVEKKTTGLSLSEIRAGQAKPKSTPIDLGAPEIDKERTRAFGDRGAVKTTLDVASANLFSGVASTAGAIEEATGKALGFTSRVGGYLGKGLYTGVGKVAGLFSEKAGTALKNLGTDLQSEMEKQRTQFREVGKDVSRFLGEGGEETKKIILKNTGYEAYKDRPYAEVDKKFTDEKLDFQAESDRLNELALEIESMPSEFETQEEVDEANAKIKQLNADVDSHIKATEDFSKRYGEALAGVDPDAFNIRDLKDPQFLLYDMFGSLVENAPMMFASIYTGGKVAGAVGATGNVSRFLANVAGTTGFSTTLNGLREAQGKYDEVLDAGGSKEQAYLESERVYTRNLTGNVGLEAMQMALLFAPQLKFTSTFLTKLASTAKFASAGFTEAVQERMEDEIQEQSESANFDFQSLMAKITDPTISKTDVISATMGILVQGIGNTFVNKDTTEKEIQRQSEEILKNMPDAPQKSGAQAVKEVEKQIEENPTAVEEAYKTSLDEMQKSAEGVKQNKINEVQMIQQENRARNLLEGGASQTEVILELSEILGLAEATQLVEAIAPEVETRIVKEVAKRERREAEIVKKTAKELEEVAKKAEEVDVEADLKKSVEELTAEVEALAKEVKEAKPRSVEKATLKKSLEEKRKTLRQKRAVPKEKVGEVVQGKKIAEEAKILGSDQGGLSDFTLDQIGEENYKTETIQIKELRKLDKDLNEYLKSRKVGEVREFAGAPFGMRPIATSKGEVLDGYNRISQAIVDGKTEIEILRGVKKEKVEPKPTKKPKKKAPTQKEKREAKKKKPVQKEKPKPKVEIVLEEVVGETDLKFKLKDDGTVTIKTLELIEAEIKKTEVSKETLSAYAQRGDIKQAERDIINDTLAEMPEGMVNVAEFIERVKTRLLPLTLGTPVSKRVVGGIPNTQTARYENITLPSEVRGNIASYGERIYESPIKNSAGGVHFSSEQYPNYFAHTRLEDLARGERESADTVGGTGSTRRIIEIQSDLFQKGRLEKERGVEEGDFDLEEARAELAEGGFASESARKEMETHIATLEKRATELAPLQPYRNIWFERIIREEIKRASQDGKTQLQFPTGETAMKIEGLGVEDIFRHADIDKPNFGESIKVNDLKVGFEIERGTDRANDRWIITEVLEDGKFKAIPKGFSEEKMKMGLNNELPSNEQYNFTNRIEQFDISGKVDTSNPIYKFYEKQVQRYLKNIHPEMERITDEQGVEWFEIKPTEAEGKAPVLAFKKKTEDKAEVGTEKEATDFLTDFKERLKLDFDVIFVDTILAKYKQEAYGITYDNTIAMVKDLTRATAQHEVVHLTLQNMGNIDAFKDITAEDVLMQKAKEMLKKFRDEPKLSERGQKVAQKLEQSIKTGEFTQGQRHVIEEHLALDFETYVDKKGKPTGKIKTFFEKLLALVQKFVDSVFKTDRDLITEYYDVLLKGKAITEEVTVLPTEGVLQSFVREGVLDTAGMVDPAFKQTITLKTSQIKTNSFDMKNARDDYSQGVRSKTKANILVEWYKGKYHLIDGHHRLVEAMAKGKKSVKVDVATLHFKLKEDRHFANLKDRYNKTADKLHRVREQLDTNRTALAEAMQIRETKQEILDQYVEEGITSLSKFVTKEKVLSDTGIEVAKEKGYDTEVINDTLQSYLKAKEEYQSIYSASVNLKTEIAGLRKEDTEISQKKREIETKLRQKKARLEQLSKDIERGYRRGVKDVRKFGASRRGQVREFGKAVNISSAQSKRLVRGRNFETMSDKDFKIFMDDMIATASELTEKEALQQDIMAEIQFKQYSKFNNLRLSLGLPTLTAMNPEQLKQYRDALAEYEFGDVFLSKRQIETVGRSTFGKTVTKRQLAEAIKENTDLTTEDLKSVDLPSFSSYANGLILSRHSNLLKYIVDNLIRAEIETERNFLQHRNRIEKLAKSARKSRKRPLGKKISQLFVPTDELVFQYVETKDTEKEKFAKDKKMTPEEIEFGNTIIAFNRMAYDHMVRVYNITSRFGEFKEKDYFLHLRRGFLEVVRDDGIKEGVANMFNDQREAELSMGILDGKTGDIVPYEKWNPFFQFRGGELKPTQNVTKAHLIYAKTFFKKKSLDSYIPQLLAVMSFRKDILNKTDTGLTVDGGVENFIKEYINTARGRKISGHLIPRQGTKGEAGFNLAITATTLLALGGRIGVGTASAVGEFVVTTTSMILHPTKTFKGLSRTLDFKRAKDVREAGRHYIGLNPLDELLSAEKGLGEKTLDSAMILFSFGRYIAHNYALQANLTPEEWKSADISTERILEISKEQNKFKKGNFHAGSLVGSTVIGRAFGQYLSWAFDIAITTASSSTRLLKTARTEGLSVARKSEYMKDVINFTASAILFGLLTTLIPVDEEDEENKTILFYIRREMNTLRSAFGALLRYNQFTGKIEPTIPILQKGSELFGLVLQLITQETYKRDGKGYGIGDKKFVRTATKLFVPIALQEITGLREERDTKNRLLQEAIDDGEIDAEAVAKVIVSDWDEKDEEYKTEKKGEITKLYNVHKTYGFDNELVNVILHGDGVSTVNNEERAELMVQYAQQNGKQETRQELLEMRRNRNLCTNTKKRTGCMISNRLWKDYLILLKKKGI